jgi:hypothetical protein
MTIAGIRYRTQRCAGDKIGDPISNTILLDSRRLHIFARDCRSRTIFPNVLKAGPDVNHLADMRWWITFSSGEGMHCWLDIVVSDSALDRARSGKSTRAILLVYQSLPE